MYVGGTAVVVRVTPAPGSQVIDGRAGEHLTVVAGKALVTYAPFRATGDRHSKRTSTMWGIDILPNGDLVIA